MTGTAMGITEQGLRNFHDVLKEIRACNSEGWFYSEHENIKNIRANMRSKQPPNLGLAIAPGFVLTQGLSFIFFEIPRNGRVCNSPMAYSKYFNVNILIA
jgi:hypothetical protein